MRLPGYRWLLPIGHLTVDTLVLLWWIWHSTVILHNQKIRSANPPVVAVGFSLQDGSGVGWNPRYIDYYPPPGEFLFLSAGNLPAGIIALAVKPDAEFQTMKNLWDPIWSLILESLSFSVWFLAGGWLDSGRLRIKKIMVAYLAARLGYAVLLPLSGAARAVQSLRYFSGSVLLSMPSRLVCSDGPAAIQPW